MSYNLLCCYPFVSTLARKSKAPQPLNHTETSFMRASIREKSKFYGAEKQKEVNNVKFIARPIGIPNNKIPGYLKTIQEDEPLRYSFSENSSSGYLNNRF